MAQQSVTITTRQFARAQGIITNAVATPEGQMLAIKAIAPDMVVEIVKYNAADAEVGRLLRGASKEVREALAAVAPLAKFYDETREVVMTKSPGRTFLAASSFTTPDDLLGAAEDLEDVLEEHAASAWAKDLFKAMVGLLDSAVKEQGEASGALDALQKAQQCRADTAMLARPLFVRFRRVVRNTFGRESREYRSLLDRRQPGDEDDTSPPTTP